MLKASLGQKDVLALLPTGLARFLVKHSCALLLVRGQRPAMSITPQAAASWLHWLWKIVTGPLWIRKTERSVQSYFFLIFAFTMGHFPWWIHRASSTNLGNIALGMSDEGSSCSLDHQDTWLIAALWGGLQKHEGSLKPNRGESCTFTTAPDLVWMQLWSVEKSGNFIIIIIIVHKKVTL